MGLLDQANQGGSLPDLGPAAALDQLRVAVFEAARCAVPEADLAAGLAQLRRRLAATEFTRP
ncbi:hypothetical protein [Gephyromycinifex aptenodytis]|uniref:hypothetical protein n=1 Tax=Gephyromycinifex aptenodytis TaxID=2716227 RepID=UPI001D00583D|nr:hypothetical protein [Gephyromycinifex aptenodytis]